MMSISEMNNAVRVKYLIPKNSGARDAARAISDRMLTAFRGAFLPDIRHAADRMNNTQVSTAVIKGPAFA